MTRTRLGLVALTAYVGVIVAANFAVNQWGIQPVAFGLAAPVAVYFVGAAFTLRDIAQEAFGRRTALARKALIAAILTGAALSYVVGVVWPSDHSPVAPWRLALASAVAFLFSELADWQVYTPLRDSGWLRAIVISNAVGLIIDSLLFLSIAFASLQYLPGQLVGKALMTGAAVALLAVLGGQKRPAEA